VPPLPALKGTVKALVATCSFISGKPIAFIVVASRMAAGESRLN